MRVLAPLDSIEIVSRPRLVVIREENLVPGDLLGYVLEVIGCKSLEKLRKGEPRVAFQIGQ